MKTLAFIAIATTAILTGCAGTSVDTDFRQKVSEVDACAKADYDVQTQNASGNVLTKVFFRDPSPVATPAPSLTGTSK
jgi:hypothetical protein